MFLVIQTKNINAHSTFSNIVCFQRIDAEFDPKKGMTIKNLKANSPVDYSCGILLDDGSVTAMDFKIVIPSNNFYTNKIQFTIVSCWLSFIIVT